MTMADPFGTYALLRRTAPVHRVALPTGAAVWLVARYNDVREALADQRLSLDKRHSNGGWSGFQLPPALDRNLLNLDPPDHTRIRRLVAQAFTARRVEAMRPHIQAVTDELVDRLTPGRPAELLADLAVPLPTRVIGDLLGVPVERREEFRAGTAALLELETADPARLKDAITHLVRLLVELIRHKRAEPGEDLLSALIAVRDEQDRLSEDELTSLAFLLLLAGHENTVHLIGLSVLTLLQHPEQAAALRADPSRIPCALQELLRFAGPAQLSIRRFPTEDVEIGGVTIRAGEPVLLALGCANRDGDRFTDAERFDIARAEAGAHVGFGHGIHYCLGAQLAQAEAEVAVRTLLRRFPNLALAVPVAELEWREVYRVRGLVKLPVCL